MRRIDDDNNNMGKKLFIPDELNATHVFEHTKGSQKKDTKWNGGVVIGGMFEQVQV